MDYIKREKIWMETLAETCHCGPDAFGNMPCDNGCTCDKCQQSWVDEIFRKKMKDAGLI